MWVDTVEAFGALKIAEVLEPAIKLAEGGFVSPAPRISTLTSLELILRVPVSEIHSRAVGPSVSCRSQQLTRDR